MLVRIRGASGTLFDPTFLNYRVSEQTRLRQITAEIFVHEGLDSAVNIDRESFNFSHPHFSLYSALAAPSAATTGKSPKDAGCNGPSHAKSNSFARKHLATRRASGTAD